ncbi:MAG: DEAD/DEAH box helicase [Bosea sp.]|uniref:DEAD/DEAH box helicase n=1 Tax=Bosea sp. (in: a-proteobacteria) TaxID=1871050 RepID=UPI0031FEC085|nr:DEAD/DEAH box helicase [Bosea sp. (in: a-proteobacteria)]
MSAFDRLSPALAYQIVNTLGFRELYPVQLAAIDAVLDGKNAVILAPTAGGKTEAAFFPLLSAMDTAAWPPVSVLYLSPLRALINDQEGRIRRYASTLGRRVFTWHGDVGPTARKRFLEDPADILLTTPESLEAMLMSPRQPARRLFSRLRAVIVDEVHAFAGDDRGAHLAALLERVSRYGGRDLQRLGLSATVGNPEEILRWLAGSSQRPGAVVDPPRGTREAQLAVDYVGSLENAARVIAQLHPGCKRLVFVDSRRRVETLTELLREQGVGTFLTHGSLAAGERRAAERAFQEGPSCVIVATSALELGIDVGDLDHVVQIDAPGSVASFLQRLGRTGRRRGATANCTFLATGERALLEAAAIIALFRSGYVEPLRPSRRAAHILAHQLPPCVRRCVGS